MNTREHYGYVLSFFSHFLIDDGKMVFWGNLGKTYMLFRKIKYVFSIFGKNIFIIIII